MTIKEFNFEFDLLYNNIMSSTAPGLNVYEKSVLLTQAQEEILKNYFNPKSNRLADGIELSPKRDWDFSNLIRTDLIQEMPDTYPDAKVDQYSKVFSLQYTPDIVQFDGYRTGTSAKVLIPLSYKLRSLNTPELLVDPISTGEYMRVMSKPYKQPFRGHAWLIYNENAFDRTSEISSSPSVEVKVNANLYDKTWYLLFRYVRIPQPIILEDLAFTEEEFGVALSVNGLTTQSECELPEEIHREILGRAVEKAKISYTVDNAESMIQTNLRNE